jgi:aminodeoxyfutalosine synthase
VTTSSFDLYIERIRAGDRLTAGEVAGLVETPDILELGMLADAVHRRRHGGRVTYLRVANCASDRSFGAAVPPAAREIRISGAPSTLDVALAAVESAKAVAGERVVSGFSWPDVERLAGADRAAIRDGLRQLRKAGLEAIAAMPMDGLEDLPGAIDLLVAAGFEQLRLTIDSIAAPQRIALLVRAAELQDGVHSIQALNPLPATLNAFRPTTGYEDVKMVALARLAAPNIPTIQVDWSRYGPKLAQVALTFGADDLDNVPATDESPQGPRRAPLAEVRRNIEAAGFDAAERDGRFAVKP